jgi:two-component system phosphate regulon response regulator PhoB
MMKQLVLIVEDEAPLVTVLRYWLEREGFSVDEAADGEEALVGIAERCPDLVLLDWMLPLVSVLEVCRRVRRAPATRGLPIIMLTARGESQDRIRGLDGGADDYVVKPFDPYELVARMRAVLRRTGSSAESVIRYADITMHLTDHQVTRGGRPVHLGPTEFRLLTYFLQNPGRVFSREQLLGRVWSPDAEVEIRTVDEYVRRLRKALNYGNGADLLRTVRSVGYALGTLDR